MEENESMEMELVLTVDEYGRILNGTFDGEKLPVEILNGRIMVLTCPDKETMMLKYCGIVQGVFCCNPPPPRCPV